VSKVGGGGRTTGGEGRGPQRVARVDEALWRRTFGGVVVLPPQSEEPLVLDEHGAMIWDLLGGAPTIDEVTQTLTCRFAAERGQIERDVLTFLDELERLGAVVMPSAP
jgi:hypothetical protein